jgi:hypothetical protein
MTTTAPTQKERWRWYARAALTDLRATLEWPEQPKVNEFLHDALANVAKAIEEFDGESA